MYIDNTTNEEILDKGFIRNGITYPPNWLSLCDQESLDFLDIRKSEDTPINDTNNLGLSECIVMIDTKAAGIYSRWTRFESEYKERENSARELLSGVTSTPSIYVTSFADAAGLDYQSAASLIVEQADKLRQAQSKIASIRMKKYLLKNYIGEQLVIETNRIMDELDQIASQIT